MAIDPNNNDDFLQEMTGVTKLAQDKVNLINSSGSDQESIKRRRQSALAKHTKYENFLTDGEIEYVQPEEPLSFKIDGVQPNVFKNLRMGKYAFDYHLDLHRMTVKEARSAVFNLVRGAQFEEFRCLLITHGKGARSTPPAKLKSYVNHWMKQIDQVIGFHSALAKHGGTGSLYVLLKKPKANRKINQAKYD